nr:hypothetical protein EUGRSUZ_D00080 [Ipomoea trifida]
MEPVIGGSDVQISVIKVRLPRITRNERRQEAMERSYLRYVVPIRRLSFLCPAHGVLDLEQNSGAVRERRLGRRDFRHSSAFPHRSNDSIQLISKQSCFFSPKAGKSWFRMEISSEIRHRFGDPKELDFERQDDAEAGASSAVDRPEKIFAHTFPVQNSPLHVHDPRVDHVVNRDTVSGDSEADSGAEDHSQGSDFEKVTGLDDFDEDLGDGSAVLPIEFIEMEFEGNDTGFLLSEIEMRAWFSNVVEEILGIHPALHRHQPLKIPHEISLPINLPFLVAMSPMVVNSDVDVSVIEERLPRITRNKRRHEAMEIAYLQAVLLVRRRPFFIPVHGVLNLEQDSGAVGERRLVRRDFRHFSAVWVEC